MCRRGLSKSSRRCVREGGCYRSEKGLDLHTILQVRLKSLEKDSEAWPLVM